MWDIRIVHDKVGSYADWITGQSNWTNGKRLAVAATERYLLGKTKPNYPMPAIRYEVEIVPECGWVRIWNNTNWTAAPILIG